MMNWEQQNIVIDFFRTVHDSLNDVIGGTYGTL